MKKTRQNTENKQTFDFTGKTEINGVGRLTLGYKNSLIMAFFVFVKVKGQNCFLIHT